MKITNILKEAGKLLALLGAIALVLWTIPEDAGLHAQENPAAAHPSWRILQR